MCASSRLLCALLRYVAVVCPAARARNEKCKMLRLSTVKIFRFLWSFSAVGGMGMGKLRLELKRSKLITPRSPPSNSNFWLEKIRGV